MAPLADGLGGMFLAGWRDEVLLLLGRFIYGLARWPRPPVWPLPTRRALYGLGDAGTVPGPRRAGKGAVQQMEDKNLLENGKRGRITHFKLENGHFPFPSSEFLNKYPLDF